MNDNGHRGDMGYTGLIAWPWSGGRWPLLAKKRAACLSERPYDKATFYRHRPRVWPGDIDRIATELLRLAALPHQAILRGAMTEAADPRKPMRCLLHTQHNDPATVEEVARAWLFTDTDSQPEPNGIDWRTNPREAAEATLLSTLPPWLAKADFIAAYTGSHGFKPGMRLRSMHLLDRPLVRSELDVLLANRGFDLALNRPRQLHYTAAPIFEAGLIDPLGGIERRFFVILRSRRRAIVPPIPPPPQSAPRPGRRNAGSHSTDGAGSIEEMLAALAPQAAGGPGLHDGGIQLVAKFMRVHGADADADALINACCARAREFGAPVGYVSKLQHDLTGFAKEGARRQREERRRDLEVLCGNINAEQHPTQGALRALLNISFLNR